MTFELEQLKYKVKELMESGDVHSLLTIIREDLGKQIIQTEVHQKEVREDLYHTSKCLDLLEMKLQEFVNEISTKENEQ